MARIPVYGEQKVSLGLSANLPYRSPDPGVVRAIERSGQAIAEGIQSWAQFLQKADEINSINVANRAVTNFRVQQPVFEKQLQEAHADNPGGYYEAWNEGMKQRIGESLNELGGKAKRRAEMELTNYHAAQTQNAFNYGTTQYFDKLRADADENLRIQTMDAATKTNDWESHHGFMEAIQRLDELEKLGVYSEREVVAEKNRALEKFEYSRARKTIFSPDPAEGPSGFRARKLAGEYDHLEPTTLQSLDETAAVEDRRRILQASKMAAQKEKDDEKARKEKQDMVSNKMFNKILEYQDMDPLKNNMNQIAGELNSQIDRYVAARVIKRDVAERYKLLVATERRAEQYNNDVYQNYWNAIFSGQGHTISADMILDSIDKGDLNRAAAMELRANMEKFHFTNDVTYQNAVKYINRQYNVEAISIWGTDIAEVSQRKIWRQNALRQLWENAKRTEGQVNHLELAHRIIKKQMEDQGFIKNTMQAPVTPPSERELERAEEIVSGEEKTRRKKKKRRD